MLGGIDWRDEARCRHDGPDDLYIDYDTRAAGGMFPEKVQKVLDGCMACPVRFDCLKFAIANNEVWGTWGGHLSMERRLIVKLLRQGVPLHEADAQVRRRYEPHRRPEKAAPKVAS